MSEWKKIACKEDLPEEGKYVLIAHNRGTWVDNNDPVNVNIVIAKLELGRTEEEILASDKCFSSCDQWGNNRVPWCWSSFGPDSFFGQSVISWHPIPELDDYTLEHLKGAMGRVEGMLTDFTDKVKKRFKDSY